MTNVFDMNKSKIERRMNPLSTYIPTNTLYLSKKYGISEDRAREIILKTVKEKGFKDPLVGLYEKDLSTLDKEETSIPLSKFLTTIVSEQLTIAPSFTCYTKVHNDGTPWRSVHARLLNVNKALRTHHKTLSKKAKSVGDFIEADIQKTIDTSKKMANNGYSGASCQLHSPIATHSSHYTFTSATRVSTSTANVVTESMVYGYRSYYTPDDVLIHWNALLKYTNQKPIQKAVIDYKLVIPTTKDIMNMVYYSSYHYWISNSEEKRIEDYVNKLTDIDKCTILYTLDLFHIIKLNKNIMDNLIDDIYVYRPHTNIDYKIVDDAEEYKINLMYHILSDRLVNKGLDLQKHKGTELGNAITSTLVNIDNGLLALNGLVDAFFKSEVLPINIASYKKAIRRAISLSDTDSSNSIYARLRDMRFGENTKHSTTSIGYIASISTIVSEVVVNALAILTTSMNVDEDKAHELSMKSEYYFPLFAPTVSSKHYLTLSYIVEMLILDSEDTEFHGVALHSNNISIKYNDFKRSVANMLKDATVNGIKINPYALIEELKELENEIEDRVLNLDNDILVFSDIKEATSYKNPSSSPYFHYELYEAVFSQKYGEAPKPPMVSVNLPLTTDTSTKLAEYIKSINDDALSERFATFIKLKGKKALGTIKLPLDSIKKDGIPEELIPIIDIRKIILNQTHSIRAVLDVIGIPSKTNYLMSECYP